MIDWKILPAPDGCAMWPGDNPQFDFNSESSLFPMTCVRLRVPLGR